MREGSDEAVGVEVVAVGMAVAEERAREARVVAPVVGMVAHGELVGARVAVVVVVPATGPGRDRLVVVLRADDGAAGTAAGGRGLQVARHVAREASQLTRHTAGCALRLVVFLGIRCCWLDADAAVASCVEELR